MTRISKRLEWSKKIELWKLSGKKASTWCREHQVLYGSFMWWLNRLSSKTCSSKEPVFCKAQFVELKNPLKLSPSISLECAGVKIHLQTGFDADLLKDCLGILRGFFC